MASFMCSPTRTRRFLRQLTIGVLASCALAAGGSAQTLTSLRVMQWNIRNARGADGVASGLPREHHRRADRARRQSQRSQGLRGRMFLDVRHVAAPAVAAAVKDRRDAVSESRSNRQQRRQRAAVALSAGVLDTTLLSTIAASPKSRLS